MLLHITLAALKEKVFEAGLIEKRYIVRELLFLFATHFAPG